MSYSGKIVSKMGVKQRLGRILSDCWSNSKKYDGFSDNNFYLPSLEEIKALVKSPELTIEPANSANESFDCDDFAFAFKGNLCLFTRDKLKLKNSICVGIAWGEFKWFSEFHACNWVLTNKMELFWIEPQFQKLYTLNNCRNNSLKLLIV